MGRWHPRARHSALDKRRRALSSRSSPSQDATCSGLLGRSISLWTHREGADVNPLGAQGDHRSRTPSPYGGRAVSDVRPGGPRGYKRGARYQTALVALRTALDVDARETPHQGRRRFPGQHGECWLRKQAVACRLLRGPTAIAQHAIVAYAHEPCNVVHCITGFV